MCHSCSVVNRAGDTCGGLGGSVYPRDAGELLVVYLGHQEAELFLLLLADEFARRAPAENLRLCHADAVFHGELKLDLAVRGGRTPPLADFVDKPPPLRARITVHVRRKFGHALVRAGVAGIGGVGVLLRAVLAERTAVSLVEAAVDGRGAGGAGAGCIDFFATEVDEHQGGHRGHPQDEAGHAHDRLRALLGFPKARCPQRNAEGSFPWQCWGCELPDKFI